MLLVDSEGVVPQEAQVWDIVANRQDDKWPRPSWATEHHLYLMVQAVETWLLTDQEKLKEYFGRGFREGVLPSTNLEARSKDEVEKALHTATEYSTKGRYKHAHANQLIGKVRQDRIKTLRHGRRLFDSLGGLIRRERQKP